MKNRKILILGVTASGKSRLGFDLAKMLDTEIISIDSMKVYKRMDIGTAKPSLQRRQQVKYHMIDIVEPGEAFSVASFLEDANNITDSIIAKNKPAVAVGGTALYIKAMLFGLFVGPGTDLRIRDELKKLAEADGLADLHKQLSKIDPEAARRIHPNDAKRIIRALEIFKLTGKPISSFQKQFTSENQSDEWTIVGLRRPKETESERINLRVKKMIEAGLVDEVKSLLAEEKPLSKQAACAIGYAEIISYLRKQISLQDAVEQIKKNTRHLAKHQRTWFKTFKNVNWIDVPQDHDPDNVLKEAGKILNCL
jgi:tRNA dimethylallyltransferase